MVFTKRIVAMVIIFVILLWGRGPFKGTAQENDRILEETLENRDGTMEERSEKVTGEVPREFTDDTGKEERQKWMSDKDIAVKEIIARGYDGSLLEDRNTVLRFQAENNLLVDGIVGSMTKEALMNENKKVYDIVPEEFKEKEWIIVINKTKKILTVYNKGDIYKKYPVALGKDSSPTPSHKFTIINKIVDPYWGGIRGRYKPVKGGDPKNPLGRRWLGLSTDKYWGYGIHGNADPFSIGKYISAGCIRMINEDVEDLFEYIPVKTEVWIGTEEVLKKWGIEQCIEYSHELMTKLGWKCIRQTIA